MSIFNLLSFLRRKPTLQGQATILDGDTIRIQGCIVRLHGIDAPELKQHCQRTNGTYWPCGKVATQKLRIKIGRKKVQCIVRGTDPYNRLLGQCSVDGTDINAWMVRNGWAIAYRHYSTAYVKEERIARSERLGIWSGEFEIPFRWRKRVNLASQSLLIRFLKMLLPRPLSRRLKPRRPRRP